MQAQQSIQAGLLRIQEHVRLEDGGPQPG